MKKTFLVSCLLSLGVTAWAQTDVTSSYLTNAGFDESADYYTGANLGSANGGANIRMVTGWTIDGYGDNSAASAYAIASSSQLNGNTPPATNYSGGADGGVLGISSAWGAQNKYSQTVTLPAGKYDLVYAYYNGGPNAADNSLVGWIPTIGTSVMSSKTSFALNTWGTEALTFILTESTEGKIQIGVGAPGVGSANVGRIFFDYVKLEFTDLFAQVNALKARLTELKDDANLPVAYDLSVANTLTGLNPTADQITGWLSDANDEIAAMEAAIAANQDATLSDLQINGVTIAGFSSSTHTYIYGVAPGTMAAALVVSATKSSAYAGVPVITQAAAIPGSATVVVTAGNASQATYTVNFEVNYLAGWNDNGGSNTPNTIGWDVPTGTTVAWGHENADNSFRTGVGAPINNGANAMLYIVSQDITFSYPASVEGKKIYQLSGGIWRRNGGDGGTSFYFDLADSREGDIVYSENEVVATGNNTYLPSFTSRLGVPAGITDVYFRFSAHANNGNWQNVGLLDLALTELGDALEVTFDLKGAPGAVSPQYLLDGAGETAIQPAAPAWDGYTFAGWYADNACTTSYDFSDPVTTDITIYAKWTADSTTGLAVSTASDALVSTEYYTLQGQKITQPAAKGFYLVKKTYASNKVSIEKAVK